jgi:alkylation response protein AidB-like acyl-CoA dehydrogenase
MNFELDQDQQMLADSVRRYLADNYDFESRKKIIASPEGCNEQTWAAFAETGLLGLAFSEEHGGFGGTAVGMMSVMEALGEFLVVEPFLPTVMASRLVAKLGSAEQRDAVIPGVIGGETKMALAHSEGPARFNVAHVGARAERRGNGWTLSGEKQVVYGGSVADRFVVSARTSGDTTGTEGISLFLLDANAAGLKRAAYRTLDNQRAVDLVFDGLELGADALLGAEGDGFAALEEAIDFGIAMLCAEASGAVRSANDDTLEYIKTRKQFGQPIGSFQALQHRMVDMFVTQEQLKSMQYLVCSRLDTTTDARERSRIASAAKIKTADACRHISQESVQLHGGMGMTEELKVSHTFRRLTIIAQQLGDADYHLQRFAQLSS